VREYLEYNGYSHALSVFVAEAGQPASPPFDRRFLSEQLGVVEDANSRRVPLLYGAVAQLQQQAKR